MRFSDAKGHKVVSTADAETVGRVDGFVVDPAGARVSALRLKKTEGDGDVLPWDAVIGFGPDAVTTGSADVIVAGTAQDHDKHRDVLGKRVLTESGDELGEVKDVEFDPETGTVLMLLTKDGEVAGERMIGLGSYALMVRA